MPLSPAETRALAIQTALGVDFNIPDVDLTGAAFQLPDLSGYATITQVDLADLTTATVGGAGAFDQLMLAHKAHLQEQFEKGRITGDQYVKAYTELTATAMSVGLQFVLGKEQAHWGAVAAQAAAKRAAIEAVKAAVELETAKATLAATRAQAETLEAQYVLTLMQVAETDAKYELVERQIGLVEEQIEATRGQTMDTRTDGTTPVAGSIGKQKELYDEQITSYQKDAAYKVGKLYTDSWTVQKTLDEGLLAPTEFQNTAINAVIGNLRTLNDLT